MEILDLNTLTYTPTFNTSEEFEDFVYEFVNDNFINDTSFFLTVYGTVDGESINPVYEVVPIDDGEYEVFKYREDF